MKTMTIQIRQGIIVLLLAVAAFTALSFVAPTKASAAYNAGNIIDSAVFLDSNSMSAQQIQDFLVARNAGISRMSFVLNCYAANSNERQLYTAAGAACDTSMPASHIIYYASQIYGINPRVILATMQKEQSLTTATNPTSWQLNQAMGYACPTSGQCGGNSTFPYQIDSGTWVLRFHYERARGNMNWWYTSTSWTCGTEKQYYKPNLRPGQDVRFYDQDNVHYATIFIQNAATSSMYCYTPHAYNNPRGEYGRAPYGTTGRYYTGSYNFVLYYELWFGDTHGTPFFQIRGGGTTTYMLGAGNTYYVINDYNVLLAYGFRTAFGQRISQVDNSYVQRLTPAGTLPHVARFEDESIYTVSDGLAFPFPTPELFNTVYGFDFGDEARLPSWVKAYLPTSIAMQSILFTPTDETKYLVENGTKRPFCSWTAFSATGSPTYLSRPAVATGGAFINSIPTSAPVMATGDLILSGNTHSVWTGSSLQAMDSNVARNTKIAACGASSQDLASLPTNGQPLSNLVKNGTDRFILDNAKKFKVNPTSLGISDTNFKDITPAFLGKLPTETLDAAPAVLRINNDEAVFRILDNKRYTITTPDDFLGLGFAWSNVKSVAAQTANLFPVEGAIFKPGRVVRVGNDVAVYMVDQNFTKYIFDSPDTFLDYGYKWSDVSSVKQTDIAPYTTNGGVMRRIAKSAQTGNHFLISGNQRRPLTEDMAQSLGITQNDSTSLSNEALSRLVLGSPVKEVFRAGNTETIYLLENGTKRPFTTPSSFLSRGYAWPDVASVPSSVTDRIPTGSPL